MTDSQFNLSDTSSDTSNMGQQPDRNSDDFFEWMLGRLIHEGYPVELMSIEQISAYGSLTAGTKNA